MDVLNVTVLLLQLTTLLGVGGVLVRLGGLMQGHEDHERRLKKLEVKHG
ncbi:MAG: hypothetical protein JKY94_01915 [Rhodobacteraceae bacterium]|nr:hypothetical protein [Paracoccaceae bacterium]